MQCQKSPEEGLGRPPLKASRTIEERRVTVVTNCGLALMRLRGGCALKSASSYSVTESCRRINRPTASCRSGLRRRGSSLDAWSTEMSMRKSNPRRRRLWSLPVVGVLLSAVVLWNHVQFGNCQLADGGLPVDSAKETVKNSPSRDDLDRNGNCSEEIKTFCTKKSESAVDCISKQLKREVAGNNTYDVKVSESCKQEWRALKISLYKDLTRSKTIEAACKKDIEKTCTDYFSPGGVLACLRESKNELSQPCQDEVFVAEQDAADDFKMDPLLSQKCSKDAAQFCRDVKSGRGRIQNCLRNHNESISFDCRAELFRQEVENAGDLRLNVHLYKACTNDKIRFCPDVNPGNSRLKDCLEANRLQPDFSHTCKAEFDKLLARRSADFRLNPRLKETCADDIGMICGEESDDASDIANEEPRIIHCLQDSREDLKNTECRNEVHKLLALAAEDYRFDKQFADSCEASKQKVCRDVENGNVLSCLQSKRESIDDSCRGALFHMEWRLSGDIDYKFAMKKACLVETAKFCRDLPHDRGAIIDCLQQRLDDPEMGTDCKNEVVADQLESAKDYRLNYRIYADCHADAETLCPVCTGVEPCGGRVLGCLQEKMDHLNSEECKKDIFSFEVKETRNIELNIPLQNSCHDDLSNFCKRRSTDHSRALACLRMHRNQLKKECQDAELRFSMMEASDMRLTPSLMNACGTELNTLCSRVSPTNGEAFKCLQLHLESISMGVACKVEVDLQGARQASDYRLDVRVRTECKEDVKKSCDDVDKKEDGHAGVLKCFVDRFSQLSGGCQTEVAYAVHMALWQYKFGSELTLPCDEVVKKNCNSSDLRRVDDFVIGTYGQCLTDQRRRTLDPLCRSLVRVGTQQGRFAGNSTDDDIAAALKKYKELRGGDELSHSGVGLFWVTTVVAFVAILAVALFRRYSGPPKTYTLVVKGGDL